MKRYLGEDSLITTNITYYAMQLIKQKNKLSQQTNKHNYEQIYMMTITLVNINVARLLQARFRFSLKHFDK